MNDLNGKRVLITASTGGIGYGIAQAFLRANSKVMINGRSETRTREVARSLSCSWCVADASVEEGIIKLVEEAKAYLGGLDILICNLGSGKSVAPGSETPNEWQRVFDLNFFSSTNLVGAATDLLGRSGGVVVCITSICGSETVAGAPLTYSAAKAALHAYVKGAASPLGKLGVRINAVAPGNINFDGSVWETKMLEDSAGVTSMLQREVPLSRFGVIEEVADAVTFLCSERAAFITGSVITVDGGQTRA